MADKDTALGLLERGLREVPVYRWLLGEDASADTYRWYGELLFTETFHGLRGLFDDSGSLLALMAISEPSHERVPVDEDLAARTRHHILAIDGFIDRFTELRNANAAASVADHAICIVFVVVHPDHRRAGTLTSLADPVVERGLREGIPVVASTADPVMSEVYTRRWRAPVRAEYSLTDGPTVWVHRSDPPAPQP